MERINRNKDREVNRLDLEKMDFHNKVREGYNILLQRGNNNMIKIDASKSVDEVFESVKESIELYLKEK